MLSKSVIKRLWHQSGKNTEAFALAVEKVVREECAVICEGLAGEADWFDAAEYQDGILKCAEAIRGRGKNE